MNGKDAVLLAEQQRGVLDQGSDPMPFKHILVRRALCFTERGKAYWNGRLNVCLFAMGGNG